jgi:hypothetical protein
MSTQPASFKARNRAIRIRKFMLVLGCGAILVLVGVYFLGVVSIAPREAITRARMFVCKRRILQYASTHGQLPSSLSQIPVIPGKDNSTDDAYGRPLGYSVQTNGLVVLTSLGRDGVPGGHARDADIYARFPARKPNGDWSDEMVACEFLVVSNALTGIQVEHTPEGGK